MLSSAASADDVHTLAGAETRQERAIYLPTVGGWLFCFIILLFTGTKRTTWERIKGCDYVPGTYYMYAYVDSSCREQGAFCLNFFLISYFYFCFILFYFFSPCLEGNCMGNSSTVDCRLSIRPSSDSPSVLLGRQN